MRILVPIDHSPPARTAFEYVLRTYPNDEILILHVINPIDVSYGEDFYSYEYVIEAKQDSAAELLEDMENTAAHQNVSIESEVVIGQPSREIVEYAEENDIDHIVIGSHGRSGVSRVLLGSVAERVVRRASVPVTVIR